MFGQHRRGVTPRNTAQASRRLIPVWLWIIFGTLAGLSLAALLYLWQPWLPAQRTVEVPPGIGLDEPIQPPEDTSPRASHHAAANYEFYDVLPRQQVTPIPEQDMPESVAQREQPTPNRTTTLPEPVAADAPTEKEGDAAGEANTRFVLQINSFDNPDEADRQMAAVSLTGLNADVRETTTRDGQVWYRVYSGPYRSREDAESAQARLSDAGIDALVVASR